MKALLLSSFGFGLLAACSPYNPDLGNQPFACGSASGGVGNLCPDGYDCLPSGSDKLCVKSGGGVIDASSQCADDHLIEPNNTVAQAYVTPVAASRASITLADLAICPAGDIDIFEVTTTTANQQLMTTLTNKDPSGAALTLTLLNSSSASIATGIPNTSMPNDITIDVGLGQASTPYFIEVEAGSGGGTNGNYTLAIQIQ